MKTINLKNLPLEEQERIKDLAEAVVENCNGRIKQEAQSIINLVDGILNEDQMELIFEDDDIRVGGSI